MLGEGATLRALPFARVLAPSRSAPGELRRPREEGSSPGCSRERPT